MTQQAPTNEEWRKLYDVTAQVKALAPWEFMEEWQLFGVQNPEDGALGFVSIMGLLGEHLAVSVYLGAEGLAGFGRLHNPAGRTPFSIVPDALLEVPQIMASFEDRDQLQKADRDLIKKLGYKFRGSQAWPLFQQYGGGLFPWYIDAYQARFLTVALEQVLDVAPRFDEDENLLLDHPDDHYLVRVLNTDGETPQWEDRVLNVPPAPQPEISVYLEIALLDELNKLGRVRNPIEIDCFLFPAPIQDGRDTRPYFSYMLLMVEGSSGMILESELLKPEPDVLTLWGDVPQKVAERLAALGVVPLEIRAGSERLKTVLQPLAKELNIKIRPLKARSMLEDAKAMLMSVGGLM